MAEAQRRFSVPRGAPNPTLLHSHDPAKIEAEQAYQRGDYERTIELATTVLSMNSADHVALYLRGSARVESGQAHSDARLVREGIADAREAIRLSSGTDANYFLPYLYGMTTLAAIENKKSHAEVAVTVAGQALAKASLKPEQRANLLYQRAMAHTFLKAFEAAVRDYSEALRLESSHLGAHIGLADAHAASGNTQKATEAFAAAVKAFPSSPLIHNNFGMYLQQQGRFDDSILEFTRALEADPRYSVAYTNRGYTSFEQGDLEAAENDFSASLAIQDEPLVRSLRGTARLAHGKLQEARDDYRQVVERDGKNPLAHADLGFASFFAGDYAAAQQAFDSAMKLDAQLRYLAPWCYWSMVLAGQADEAKARFAKLPNPDVTQRDWIDHLFAYLNGASAEEELLKHVDQSDSTLRDSQRCEAHFFIGQRKIKSGEAKEADDQFRLAIKTNMKHLSAYRGAQYALKAF